MKTTIKDQIHPICTLPRQLTRLLTLLGGLAIFATSSADIASAASPPGDVVGKVTVGYQAWFTSAGDGSPINAWGHDNLENWPDVNEYATTYSGCPFWQGGVGQPGFTGNLGNGQPAKMYAAYDQQVINTHFLWMRQNGIDTVALQAFASQLTPGSIWKAQRDGLATMVKNAAQTFGRKFFIMFDASATDPLDTYWTDTVVNTLHLTSSSAYAKQNGKPVVAIFGIGKSGRGTAAQWLTLINKFKALGCYFIGGPISGFTTDTTNASAYLACDMIMPWMVGRYTTSISNESSYFGSWYTNDLSWCNANGIDYQADIYPGSAFYNTNLTAQNLIPRRHGDFMWSQFAAARLAGVQSVFVAMFDEMNEATSIYKCAEDTSAIPFGKYFLTLDADGTHVSSDFYLRLVNNGIKMVKGTIPYQASHTTPFLAAAPADGTYKIVARHSGLALDVSHGYTANGSLLEQWTYNGGSNQRWTVTKLGGNVYKIVGVGSGRALEIAGSSIAAGAAADIRDYTGDANQRWTITPTDSGYYSVVNVNSSNVLEVYGGVSATSPGAAVDQWLYGGLENNKQWSFQAP